MRLSDRQLHGFAHMRTRPATPLQTPRPEPRRCTHCNAVLWSRNPGTLCAPCVAAGREEPPEPEDTEAPFCACGCGQRTQRAVMGWGNNVARRGPYQRFVRHHNHGMYGREVTRIEEEAMAE